MTRTIAKALALSLALVGSAHAADTYPRLATYAISAPHNYWDASYQQKLAKLHFSILATYPTWGSSRNTNINTVAKQIKAYNPNTKVFVYVVPESMRDPPDGVWSTLHKKVEAEKWWLYSSGTSGSQIGASFAGNYLLNVSPYSRKDSSGRTYAQWFASYVASTFVTPNPAVNGIYTDNVFWKPRKDGDWDRNGSIDSQNSSTVQANYRKGHMMYLSALKGASSGKYHIANVADWVLPSAVITEYVGKYNGGLIEGMIGKSWSLETQQGWGAMMTGYRKVMNALASPKLGMCVQTGSLGDYKGMRYGLASCSMEDGYYVYSDVNNTYNGVPWFDEFNFKLGAAVSGPSRTAWKNGVYRRDFQNGIILVNPKGNGARTVTLETDFIKFKGAQAPTVNNGATVRTVTLQDRDGLFLKRKSAVVAPAAIENFTVSVD
jgi:hypothetical protein